MQATLCVGSRIEVAAAARANTEERRDFNVQEIRQGDSVELHPGDTAKLFSIEILDLPPTCSRSQLPGD